MASQVGSALHDARSLAADIQHKVARALHVEPQRAPRELHVSMAAPPHARPRPATADGAGLGMLYAVLAAFGCVAAVLAVRAASGARSRRAQGGRWVRDRSLGGKMVRFVAGLHRLIRCEGAAALLACLLPAERGRGGAQVGQQVVMSSPGHCWWHARKACLTSACRQLITGQCHFPTSSGEGMPLHDLPLRSVYGLYGL